MVTCCGFSTWTTPQHGNGSADYSRFDAINAPLEKVGNGSFPLNKTDDSGENRQYAIVYDAVVVESQTLMYQYHSNDLSPCWRQLQGHNGIYDFKSPPAAKHASGRTRSTHGFAHTSH
jgi:hypothetical protein